MTGEQNVKTVVWPTVEPEIPPRAAAQPAIEAMEEAGVFATPPAEATADHLPAGIGPDSTHACIWHRAADAAAVLRTLVLTNEGGGSEGPLAGLSARQVVSAFLCGLGTEVGSRVLRHLHGDSEIRWVGQAVAEEKQVRHHIAMAGLEFVRQRIETGDYLEPGGHDYAIHLLERVVGPHKARALLRTDQVAAGRGFELLKDVAPEQVAPFISHEHPQTIAIVLSQLEPRQAAGILMQLPQRMQADVTYRMTSMEDVTAEALVEIEEAMEASLRDVLAGNRAVGGPKVVADMLNFTGSSVEKNVLDQLDSQAPEMAEAVRNLMFTFADIAKLTDREIQVWLREIDQKDLVVSLKAAEEELKDKILGNLSEQVRTLVSEEMEHLGPMRLSEVEEVQLRCVQQVRQLEEQGKITIVRGDHPDIFV